MLGQIKLRKEVANRLEQARLAAGFNNVQSLCEDNNISLETYMRHETGRSAIKASQAMQYCRLFNISLHWLMLGEERNQSAAILASTEGQGLSKLKKAKKPKNSEKSKN